MSNRGADFTSIRARRGGIICGALRRTMQRCKRLQTRLAPAMCALGLFAGAHGAQQAQPPQRGNCHPRGIMSFLAPLFLAGALAVALPILFHLIRKTTNEKTIFSSLMFLLPTPPKVTRRSRLDNI